VTTKKKYFGTDGIRGQVGKSLINPEFIMRIGWAVGMVLGTKGETNVLIGKDTRISGYLLESALQAGFIAAGVNAQLLGPMPTPAIAYLTHSLRAQAGVVISASHNPYHDNGVKFFDHRGFKLSDELEIEIEAHLEMPMRVVAPQELGRARRIKDAKGRYIEFCKSTFPTSLSLKGLKIVLDCANGATYHVAPCIFHELGATIITIGDKPDGFNINHECGATDTRQLQKAVIAEHADLGIALDGDGDRVIMVDHAGNKVDGDEILCILATDRITGLGGKTGVVGTVMSNLGLEQTLAQYGIPFERASVGDRYVLERLMKNGWSLGGESSGHIVDLDYTTTGDGIISALQVLRIIQMSGKSLQALCSIMTKRPQVMINVPVFKAVDVTQYPQIAQAVTEAEKHLADKGRVLLRASGTEPVVRVMVEGNEEGLVRETAEDLATIVEKAVE
jgi:phosphoglucosamine mutase